MTDFLVQQLVKARKKYIFWARKAIHKKNRLGFSSKIEMPQLGLAQNLYSSARVRKFQLELITTSQPYHQNWELYLLTLMIAYLVDLS